jgi:hypothetical protein
MFIKHGPLYIEATDVNTVHSTYEGISINFTNGIEIKTNQLELRELLDLLTQVM